MYQADDKGMQRNSPGSVSSLLHDEYPNKGKGFSLPETFWPVDWGKKTGLYFFLSEVQELKKGRVLVKDKGEMIMLSSYSYLGLLGHPSIESAAKDSIDSFSTGTHGVRLLAGTTSLHVQLEKRIARFKNTEDAIVFSSGYVTNMTTISTLVGRGDYVFCDKLNHASIFDGCLLSGAKLCRFNHKDTRHLEIRLANTPKDSNKLVVVDAVFSMDGDIVNLPEISGICKKYGAYLMVDEAHSLGVLGKNGHGIEEHFGLNHDIIDVKMGTLSKTIPSAGGYVAGSSELIKLLKHSGRGFIYSAALPPPQVGAALKAFDIIEEEKWRIKSVQYNMAYFRKGLNNLGFNTLNTETAIIPVICGEDKKSWKMAKRCQDKGLFVQGIPCPVVPKGLSRLRCIVTADHTKEDLDYCLNIIEEAGKKEGVI